MLPEISEVKGIHPGIILRRVLKLRGIKGKELAYLVNEHKQTISAILNKRRSINVALSIKLARQFEVSEDYFLHLQASYDVERALEILKSERRTPNLKKIRRVLFWDTNFDQIDWDKQKVAIIRRIMERGNDSEIEEMISFYGRPTILDTLQVITNDFLPSFRENREKYFRLDK